LPLDFLAVERSLCGSAPLWDGVSENEGDCDDDAATFPGAAPNDGSACMTDADGDDYGEEFPVAGVTPGSDCDDDPDTQARLEVFVERLRPRLGRWRVEGGADVAA